MQYGGQWSKRFIVLILLLLGFSLTAQAESTGNLYVEINAVLNEDTPEITNIHSSCAQTDQEKMMFDTFQNAARDKPHNDEAILPNTLQINGKEASITWHRSLKLYPEGAQLETEEQLFKGFAYLEDVPNCNSFTKEALSFSETIEVENVENTEIFTQSAGAGGTCEVLWQRSASVPQEERLTYVIVTDKDYEDYLKGDNGLLGWRGPAITPEQEKEILDFHVHRLLEVPPFYDYQTKMDILVYRSDTRYCEGVPCEVGQIKADILNAIASNPECSPLGPVQNFKFMLYISDYASSSSNSVGYSLGDDGGVVQFGGMLRTALFLANQAGKTVSDTEQRQWRLNEMMSMAYVTIHEFGHSYDLDHRDCIFSGAGSFPLNSPVSFCYTTMQNCESMSNDDCEQAEQNTFKVATITRAEPTVPIEFGYMSGRGIFIDKMPVPMAQYQEMGKAHSEFIHTDVLDNRFGMTPDRRCGNGMVEQGEEVDNTAPLFAYDRDRDAVGYCNQMHNIPLEMEDRYPLQVYETEDKVEDYITSNRPRYTPFETGVVTNNRNSCRLAYNCHEFDYPGPSGHGPKLKIFDDYNTYGFLPSTTQTDCSLVDYRFKPGKQTTNFNGNSNPGMPQCDYNNHFQRADPFLPEEDETIFYAYRKDDGTTKTLETGISDLGGFPLKKASIPYPAGAGELLQLEYVEFHPSDWSHGYDPTNQPDTAFSEFRHPIGLFAVFDNKVIVYRFKNNLLDGIDPTPFRTFNAPGTITKSVDISYDLPSRTVMLTYFLNDGQGPTGEHAFQLNMRTIGSFQPGLSHTKLLDNVDPHLPLVFSNQGISPDKKAIVSIRDAAIPVGGLYFIQSTQDDPALMSYRTLTPDNHFLEDTVVAKTSVGHDAFGRYTFTTVENNNPAAHLSVNRYTLTAEGLRKDSEALISSGLLFPKSFYEYTPVEPVHAIETIEGPVVGVPIQGDSDVAVVNADGQVSLLPSDVPNMIAFPYEPFFALDAVTTTTYNPSKAVQPVDFEVNPVLLTTLPFSFPVVRLYKESFGFYNEVDIETATVQGTEYRHFTVLASGIGRVPTLPTTVVTEVTKLTGEHSYKKSGTFRDRVRKDL